jgi:hypothetical protein
MQSPAFAWILITAGVILFLASAFADRLGFGQEPRFGWKQTLGVLLGLIAVVVGLYFRRRRGSL